MNLLHRTGEEPTVHGTVADLYVIQEGTAVLESGGTVENAKANGVRPGDMTGTAIKGATRTVLGKGDVVFIPPGVPHRFVTGETDVWYLNTHLPAK
jgi:mannose-6-phosphate isomerase-like protein (cupin superfamily)